MHLILFQVTTLREEVETLKADRERVNSSMKDIIHGAEGYKVGSSKPVSGEKHIPGLGLENDKTMTATRLFRAYVQIYSIRTMHIN